jgi:hypothetical protein
MNGMVRYLSFSHASAKPDIPLLTVSYNTEYFVLIPVAPYSVSIFPSSRHPGHEPPPSISPAPNGRCGDDRTGREPTFDDDDVTRDAWDETHEQQSPRGRRHRRDRRGAVAATNLNRARFARATGKSNMRGADHVESVCMREKWSVHEDANGASYWSPSWCAFNEHSNLAFSLRDVHVYLVPVLLVLRWIGTAAWGGMMIKDPIFISWIASTSEEGFRGRVDDDCHRVASHQWQPGGRNGRSGLSLRILSPIGEYMTGRG